MEVQTFENIIIGFGKAGRALARTLASRSQTVLLIEKDKEMYGGTCPNVGCAPSKALASRAVKNVPFLEAMAQKRELVLKLRAGTTQPVAAEEKATILNGLATFKSDELIEITLPDGQKQQAKAGRIFIDTGAAPVIPPIPGLKESPNLVTSKEIMELDSLPEELVVIGAGYIGLEFASMFARFGSKVTVIDPKTEFIPMEDHDIAQRVLADMRTAGIQILLGSQVVSLEEQGSQTKVLVRQNDEDMVLLADKVLAATGRKPNIEGLGLENTRIQLTENGAIKVDDSLKTTVENIWAMGDVKGGPQFYYLSTDDYRIVENHLFGDATRRISDRNPVPYNVFLTPPLSRVGLNEKDAQAQRLAYQLLTLEASAIVKAKVIGETRGLLKALVDPDSKQILGAALYCEESHELINTISLLMKAQVPYTSLTNHVFTHPTFSEAFNDLFK